MRQCICKAYGLAGEEKTDAFDSETGELFLTHEIGLEGRVDLPPEATNVAKLVGYQKLALMMIGGMVVPIGKKKRRWTWTEVKTYVYEIRSELSLDYLV